MEEKLLPLQQALQEVANKPTENSEIALLMFGETNRVLFDFAEPDAAPWADAIPSFTAGSGGTAMFLALQKAVDMLPARPVCTEKTRFIVFGETVCRQNRIVLMSDGMAGGRSVCPGNSHRPGSVRRPPWIPSPLALTPTKRDCGSFPT